MGEITGISWCDHTFNTWWGCVRVSEACQFCYAEEWADRKGFDVWGPTARRRFFGEAHWQEPLRWNRKAERDGVRRRVFCSSMADVFEMLSGDHPDADAMASARARLFDDLIPQTPWLDWLILTKRPQAMSAWSQRTPFGDNVIAMTTVENQERLDERILHLLNTRARRRGLSIEPLLGAVRVDECAPYVLGGDESNPGVVNAFNGLSWHPRTALIAPRTEGGPNGISWVIVGGESGKEARPTHPDWIRSLRDQCIAADVPFHFKQWGEWAPFPAGDIGAMEAMPQTAPVCLVKSDGRVIRPYCGLDAPGAQMVRIGKKGAGHRLDGREWLEFPREVAA